jgi:hypothetical protein
VNKYFMDLGVDELYTVLRTKNTASLSVAAMLTKSLDCVYIS